MSGKLVKSVEELGLERLHLCSKSAADLFLPSVRACFGVDRKEDPVAFGTCFLLRVSGRPFLVTAAHVIDANDHSTIYVAGSNNLVLLEATFQATVAPGKGRKDDHFDFAFSELSDKQCSEISASVFIEEHQVSPNQASSQGRFYMALGYPASRQKVVWGEPVVRTKPWTYIGVDRDQPKLTEKLKVSQQSHFFVCYDKRAKTAEGEVQNAVSPVGASGGVLVDLGPMGLDQYRPECPCIALLAGILIEHYAGHKVILAVKIQLVLEQIRRHLGG